MTKIISPDPTYVPLTPATPVQYNLTNDRLTELLNHIKAINDFGHLTAHDAGGQHKAYIDVAAYASLSAAITAIGATETVLYITNNQSIASAVTVPTNITIRRGHGGKFTKSGTGTLAFNGPFEWSLTQAFYGFSAGDVTFGSGSVKKFYLEWWGGDQYGVIESAAALQAAIDAPAWYGKVLITGNFRISSQILGRDAITLQGFGHDFTNGVPSRLNFSTLTTAHCLLINGKTRMNINDIYLTGPSSGAFGTIVFSGSSRHVNMRNVTVNTSSTGNAIDSLAGTLITSTWDNVRTVGGGYGIAIGETCTSINMHTCYATSGTSGGFLLKGTYINCFGCAGDGNYYAYVIQNASQVGLYGCGGETSIRTAVYLLGTTTGVTITGFRSHANNSSGIANMPSFLNVRSTVSNVTVIDCRDSSPHASTVNSVASYDPGTPAFETPGPYLEIIHPNFDKLIHANVLGLKKGTTANRPTYGVNDALKTYLDTTLDADGKPITWTGTAWVDATGAVV